MIVVTGSGGLIGSQAVVSFSSKGHDVVGIDNNLRSYFFGKDGDVSSTIQSLKSNKKYQHHNIDIRNFYELEKLFKKYNKEITGIIHCAAQPSHDWACKEPLTDFSVNALGTNFKPFATNPSPEAGLPSIVCS